MVANYAPGFIECDQCRRGFILSLCFLFVCVIFYAFVSLGIYLFDNFVRNEKSLRAFNDGYFASKNVLVTIDSLAFGGRGVFITSKNKAILCQAKISSKGLSFGFYFPHNGCPTSNEIAKSIGISAFGLDTMLCDMNCWFPEGPMINEIIFCVFLAMSISFLINDSARAQLNCAAAHLLECLRSMKELLKRRLSWAHGGRDSYSKNSSYKGASASHQVGHISSYFDLNILLKRALIFMIGAFVCGHAIGLIFDSTCGYPGEGPVSEWSSKHPNLSMATWNTRSLTYERFYYCQSLGYDALALTELWRNAPKFADGTVRWTYSIAKKNDITGLPVFDKDKAAGVGILLSARAQRKYLNHGSPCERICWVRLKGPTVNLFIIAV